MRYGYRWRYSIPIWVVPSGVRYGKSLVRRAMVSRRTNCAPARSGGQVCRSLIARKGKHRDLIFDWDMVYILIRQLLLVNDAPERSIAHSTSFTPSTTPTNTSVAASTAV
jgi:hypothetical protein